DFALMSWVGISLFLLHETRAFSRRRESILLGIALGLGMLCKQPFLFFLGLPVAYNIILATHNRQSSDQIKSLKNIALALLLAAILAGIWYGPHLDDIRE